MDISSTIDLMSVILKSLLPIVLIVNVTLLIVNMTVNAMFRGKLSIKID